MGSFYNKATSLKTYGLKSKNKRAPAAPEVAPELAPTIDTAEQGAMNQRERLKRRRGVMANIFAGKETLG